MLGAGFLSTSMLRSLILVSEPTVHVGCLGFHELRAGLGSLITLAFLSIFFTLQKHFALIIFCCLANTRVLYSLVYG